MINEISKHLKEKIDSFNEDDNLLFNNTPIKIESSHFKSIQPGQQQSLAFIDGGQAEIISAANFSVSFIRVAALIFNGERRENVQKEFYLVTTARYDNDITYESKIFGDTLIEVDDLTISSNDASLKTGTERAPINKVANVARRFAELALASTITADFIILDGTLEKTYNNEEKYLSRLLPHVTSLAKSSSLFTTSGNSPTILLNKLGPEGCWSYFVGTKTYFVKLHEKAKHVFRFEGNINILQSLVNNSQDALFLGYPYGLLAVDKIARISNNEKSSLKMRFLLNTENKEIARYITTSNAHDILDTIG
jgi:hypothetical protein